MYNLVKKDPFDFTNTFYEVVTTFFEKNSVPDIMKNKFSNIEVVETDTSLNISIELPGVDIDDVDISVNNDDVLTIKGEKKSESTNEENGKVIETERYYGSFERSVNLGQNIDKSNIEATYKKGILNIMVPKIDVAEDTVKIKVK
jgi:HSP20 family protein